MRTRIALAPKPWGLRCLLKDKRRVSWYKDISVMNTGRSMRLMSLSTAGLIWTCLLPSFRGKENFQGMGRRRILVLIKQFIPLPSAGFKKKSCLMTITSLNWTEKEFPRSKNNWSWLPAFLSKHSFQPIGPYFQRRVGWRGWYLFSTPARHHLPFLCPRPPNLRFPNRRGRDCSEEKNVSHPKGTAVIHWAWGPSGATALIFQSRGPETEANT